MCTIEYEGESTDDGYAICDMRNDTHCQLGTYSYYVVRIFVDIVRIVVGMLR